MAEYDEVLWAISHFSESIQDRITKSIEAKYSTIERAIEHLQVSSSAMSTYLNGERVQGGIRHESYPGVPFFLKMAMVGYNLHWLLTGDWEMELDPAEGIDSARMPNQEYLAVLEKYRLHSPRNLDKALGLVVSLTGLREYLSCDVIIEIKSPLERKATPSANSLIEEEAGKAAATEFNDGQEWKRKAATKSKKQLERWSDQMTNTLYYGDCLDVLRGLAEDHLQGIADLIHLDPRLNMSIRDISGKE